MEIFNNLCRACNTENPNLLNIFNNNQQYEESVTLKNMLEYCLQTPIQKEAMYPNVICFFCVKQLEISYRFLQRFKLAQNEFKEAYNHMKGLNINPEADVKDNCDDIEVHVQRIEGVDQDDNLGSVSVFLPEYFQKIKKHIDEPITLNTTTENIERKINIPKIEDEAKFSFQLAKTCLICNKTFLTSKARNLHYKISHKRCRNEQNDSSIDYLEKLKTIKIETTKSNVDVQHSEPIIKVPAIDVSNKSDFPAEYCSICNKPFFTSKALNLHLKLTHKQKITFT